MTVSFDAKIRGPDRYWQLALRPATGGSVAEWSERFEIALKDSVRAHLVADVPFGAFLSGGLDSTSVVAVMADQLSTVRTFSIGFEENDYDELLYARKAAQVLGTDHHEEIVRPNSFGILPDLVRHYGEPFGDSSAIPTYYVSRLARRQVPMVLTGDGGDELFLGYPRYAHWAHRGTPLATRPGWKQKLRAALQFVAPRRFPPDPKPRPPGLQDWMKEITWIDRPMRLGLWRPEFAPIVDDHVEEIEQVGVDALSAPLEQFGQHVDIVTYLPHDILTKVDVATMMHGLEARTPLADVRMAEFAATVPWKINLGQNADISHWSGKQLLKRFLGKHFDHGFLHRQKRGFNLPLKYWFAEHSPLWPELNDRLLTSSARIHRYFRPESVKQFITGHGSAPTHVTSQQVWQLLFLENWLEHVHDAGTNKEAVSVQPHRLPRRERLC